MNRITQLFNIQYPIVQGGMIWCSGWRLAAAVSKAGGLGLIGAGSMMPDLLREHIRKCKAATDKPFGVNIPLIFEHASDMIEIIKEEKVKIVFTSAGNPSTWTPSLKAAGITVVHVIANVKFAKKCEEVGVDAIVAEGFEAGGHNGKEETTTLVLIPMVRESVKIPLIAAGGIGTGRQMFATFALGAEGVQVGSRFVTSVESSAHEKFKQIILGARDGDTHLLLKKLIPVRLVHNKLFNEIYELEMRGGSKEELLQLVGSGRAKRGMFEGDLDEGELEIGQVSGLIHEIKPAGEIVKEMINGFNAAAEEAGSMHF